MLFTKKDLRKLIVPLIIEQILSVTVGMADIIMISSTGEAAVSGVSLVDTLNILLINIFAALATGGAVVAGHYLGEKNKKEACKAAGQLLLFSAVSSVVIMGVVLLGRSIILNIVFGAIDHEVMEYASIYLLITGISIPFLAIYNSGAALFRAMGNSQVTMRISIFMNALNIAGNALFIYGLHWGVRGAAVSSLISRIIAAGIIMIMLLNSKREIHISPSVKLKFHGYLIKKILRIGVPNGMENSMFQIGKLLVLSLAASFGTSAIAANAVSNTIGMFQVMPGMAIGLAILAVVAQCVGASDYGQAQYYTKLLVKMTYICMLIVNILIFIFCPYILKAYHLTEETLRVTTLIIRYHAVCCVTIWPLSFSIPYTLRAANDVIATMLISIASMWIFRIAFSYILGRSLGLGVFGLWVAMTIDWLFRGIFFSIRYWKGKWRLHKN
ncbi:MATE family efflux transporter [Anaerosacchariphilus polymeriproducens]|uniref:Probable multidrug resistance protein NorM n=1 Tax=Anaerosacchariphilus polymeriproducens TaxID=1812858 RepID=A0A371AV48_9FIRM|nr:MATE family efflux transporter [Anaerosacchariphilus polymeriproducens]RDU23421.1 MATE family efflux transporter [Anaerosacchariphilus polymeriproducens]